MILHQSAVAAICGALFLLGSATRAQIDQLPRDPEIDADATTPYAAPSPSAQVLTLLSASYHGDEERAMIALRHGLWEPDQLTDARTTAIAALTRGAITDPEFQNPDVAPELRAEALLRAGRPEDAVALLHGVESYEAIVTRARALVEVGKADEADALIDRLVRELQEMELGSGDAVVECVRATLLRIEIRGQKSADGGDYRLLMRELGRVRTQIDPLSPGAPLAEAELLFSKDNYPEAGKALDEALKLNPRDARAWRLLGQVMVDTFDLESARRVAARLDQLAAPSISPDAAIIRSRAAVRQSDWKTAQETLAPALAAYPRHRDLRAAEAAAAAGTFDMQRIEALLAAFDQLSPGNPAALLQAGKAMAEARQYDEAALLLNRAVEKAPHRMDGLVELGLSQLQAGRLDEAAEALDAAAKIDNFNVRVDNSRKLLDEIRTFASRESDHFIVRCKPGLDEIVAEEMLQPLERIYARVTGSGAGGIDHAPARKTVVELYPNHRWFAVRITGMTGIHTIAAATGPVIAMEAPAQGGGHMGPYDWPRVVQHEFTHTVTLSRTKNRLPHWFTEASAVYLEDAPRDWSTVSLLQSAHENDALFDFASINLAFVRPKRPQDRSLAYAQGHWMYEYMIERFGPRSVLDLMDLYATGTSEPDAFNQVLKVTREAFLDDFKAWARTQLIAWGMNPPENTPSMEAILEQAQLDSNRITLEQLDGLLTSHPGHADLLRLKVKLVTKDEKASPKDVPMLEEYAKARPVDPLPHRLLAALYLSGELQDASATMIIPHLEYLDAREQSSPVYARELASLYAAMDRMDLALAKAARSTQIAPYDASQREAAAAIALRAKAYDVAERHIRVLIALEPDRPIHSQRLEALTRLRDAR